MSQVFKKAMQLLLGTDEPSSYAPNIVNHNLKNHSKKTSSRPFKKLTERELIQLESNIGALIFGAVPEGHRREFFNLDPYTWIWYDESPKHNSKKHKSVTIRYEVHQNGILKVQEGARYCFIEGRELDNFVMATQIYYERVCRNIYHRQPNPALVGLS